jgi:predicted acylesterase/phospholipase RssA
MSVPDPIRHSNLLGSLSDAEAREILSACRRVHARSGEVLCRQGERGESMFVIVSGRVSIDVANGPSSRQLINYLGPGDHFGEMSLLLDSPRSANVTAVMDTDLLELSRSDFEHTLASVPLFAANLSRSLGVWLRGQISGSRRPALRHVALVRGCAAAAGLAAQLVETMSAQGGRWHVISDQPPCRSIADWQFLSPDDEFERQALAGWARAIAARQRVLLDVDPARVTPRLLMRQELVWWALERDPSTSPDGFRRLTDLLEAGPQLARRVQLLWAIPDEGRLPAAGETPRKLAHPALRLQYAARGATRARRESPDPAETGERRSAELAPYGPTATFYPRDVARLVHHLRGVQVGLALGGGGARGIAHLGVLEVCEHEGIFFDRIAGTSAGAIIAAGSAAGIPLPRILEVFEKEMAPPAALRWLPRVHQWYLLAVFRLGLAEAKFRRYLHDYTFEELLVPASMVTVDLVSGEPRIRNSGDVVRAVLESTNHPVFGRPILRDGEALVDGGVVMNVPVTALRQQNVDFTVAVDVSKQLSPTFAGNTKDTPTARMRRPGYISTLLRVTDVELKNLAALHGAQCDFLIEPNTADFPFDDFSQGAGLVEAGRRAAEESLPRLKQLLAEQLRWDGDPPATAAGGLPLSDAA